MDEKITDEQIEELRGAIEAEKDSIDEELASYGKQTGAKWEGSSESEGAEADPSDAADNIEELATNIPIVGELEKRHKELEGAIERMDSGTYGLCDVCGEPILFDRLDANPAARTCTAHIT